MGFGEHFTKEATFEQTKPPHSLLWKYKISQAFLSNASQLYSWVNVSDPQYLHFWVVIVPTTELMRGINEFTYVKLLTVPRTWQALTRWYLPSSWYHPHRHHLCSVPPQLIGLKGNLSIKREPPFSWGFSRSFPSRYLNCDNQPFVPSVKHLSYAWGLHVNIKAPWGMNNTYNS